ncbi:methylated-DNA--[protein]-cysteine S-methyltransferase [Oceanospirillum multiglobuliferum]|uniref:Uncharacterized protein n=1 Tax=Oceanospirillum multiglobuliferum TaxID=64969 RepID=A0A1V4T8M0_9GAMM|nr:methylated-DNA--[protein]-cysteine S-methyltransferase [Oceanospirillum multiglobuliferum]OPX56260.1 hypothetical protein BTE48_04610 [Oceanospirillum multiglobuliferum]
MNINYMVFKSQFGALLVAHNGEGICTVLLADDEAELQTELARIWPSATLSEAVDDAFRQIFQQVLDLVNMPQTGCELPLALKGTDFQKQVWQALLEIPVETTISYRELAQKIGKPKAIRAVASACAANKIAVLIPCHRVVRNDGSLSGYRWGLARKAALLAHEQFASSKTDSD